MVPHILQIWMYPFTQKKTVTTSVKEHDSLTNFLLMFLTSHNHFINSQDLLSAILWKRPYVLNIQTVFHHPNAKLHFASHSLYFHILIHWSTDNLTDENIQCIILIHWSTDNLTYENIQYITQGLTVKLLILILNPGGIKKFGE